MENPRLEHPQADNDSVKHDAQITVCLHTRLPEMLVIPDTPFTVPANTNRYGLSQVINHLLELSPPRPFDFLVNGQLLRASLAQTLAAQQLSAEEVIDVEYLLAVLPPKPKTSFETDDWVGCLTVARGVLASGLYDGCIRVWGAPQGPMAQDDTEHCTTSGAHQGPVTALAHCQVGKQMVLVSGGKDGALWLWHLPLKGSKHKHALANGASTAAELDLAACEHGLQAAGQLSGQTASVGGLAGAPEGAPGGPRCIAGGWDGAVRLWQLPELAAAEKADSGKSSKRKAAARESVPDAAPLSDLPAHKDNVSTVAWPSPSTAITGSWDHTVRLIDLNKAQVAETHNGSKAVYTLAPQPSGGNLIAFGGADNAVRLWDPRGPAGALGAPQGVQALISHKHWVSGVAWRPGTSNQLASVSHDHTLKVWDIRSDIPLHTVEAHTDKVLCVAWLDSNRVASGGADKLVKVFEMSTVELA